MLAYVYVMKHFNSKPEARNSPWTCLYCKVDFYKYPHLRPTLTKKNGLVLCWGCYRGPLDYYEEHIQEKREKPKQRHKQIKSPIISESKP